LARFIPDESVHTAHSSPGAEVVAEIHTRALDNVSVVFEFIRNTPRYSTSPALASAAETSSHRLFNVPSVIVVFDFEPPRDEFGEELPAPPEKQNNISLDAIGIIIHLSFSDISFFS
jgi:hypothetical protein